MKKKLFCLFGFLILFNLTCDFVEAKTSKASSQVQIAIKKYKAGNYTGCLQDCQNIVKYNPNGLAYYYMALSYTKAGKRTEAIDCYSRTISLSKTPKLVDYATKGKRCLETPEQCSPTAPGAAEDDLDRFINANSSTLSDSVKNDYQQKRLNNMKNEMNNGKDLDDYNFNNFKDYSNQHSYNNLYNKIAQAYTDDDIQNALKVLNDSGYKVEAQDQNLTPELVQIKAMLGNNSNNQNATNSMADMLPYMLSKQKDGTASYPPEVLQSIIMNSTNMNDFNFELNENR